MGKKQAARPPNATGLLMVALVAILFIFPSSVTAAGPEIGRDLGLTRRAIPDLGEETKFINLFGRAAIVDDHTCAKGRPCLNGACCGSSGACGYGPAYCGIGCTSNCDAKAERGQFSADGKKTCPLNVCCSQFGFCGSTAEFSDPSSGCQSNCGTPHSPGSGGNVRSQIIGYYESWSSYSGRCGSLKPSQLPVSALNIVNFAFAYISPETAQNIPMVGEDGTTLDDSEADKLYKAVTSARFGNPNTGFWLALGGWTFNDNNTIFQPVFGQIASNGGFRRQFAENLVAFMSEYGFDGVDIDWEYPGAGDRGGTKNDYDSFPLLLQAIRQAFNDHGHGCWGISITAPSSYWYLQWFNLGELVKHVNYINLMSYDLHGIWDQNNEIGKQILAHTNLTEVDHALELFWRNNVDPKMINLGVAFYGRSYKLADASCRLPGCRFSGPGDKGECSNTEGYLSYREIMDKIKQAGDSAEELWDEVAGVKMLVYDSNNWISYDDSTTFQQKVDFANQRGLAGLMIWASDVMGDFDISRCYITDCGGECPRESGLKEMTRLNLNEQGKGCPKSGKDSQQRALCCPPWGAPDPATCHWTKGCNDKCSVGETTLAVEDYGGGSFCSANRKQFCCPASNIDRALSECQWYYGFVSSCPKNEKPQLLAALDSLVLCCPKTPRFKRSTCNWYGSSFLCRNSNCPVGKVTVARTSRATPQGQGCWVGGQKSYCCDSPYGVDAGGTLPVALDHLFPEYQEIPADDEAVYEEALDSTWSWDIDPDTTPFAWVVMVGPPESVQSLDKRDGSSLESFDCPNPDAGDYSVQTFKAVCLAESEDHDCEDLLLGDGAYGTIARFPPSCGPDEWVRVVSFKEIDNSTLPHHLVIRSTPASKVYEIKYDYRIRDVASDEIFTKKRSGISDWREPHMEWFRQHELRKRGAGNDGWWKNLFNNFLTDGSDSGGEAASYQFDQVLYEASISCPPSFDASMSARVQGSIDADLDYGVSLIGRVKDTKFEQAFAYFSIKEFDANAQIYLEGEAQFTFESREAHLLSNFAPWGGSFNIKGLVTIGPFMDLTAQIDAIAILSGQFASGVEISNRRLSTDEASPLTWMYPPSMESLPDPKALYSGMFPSSTTIRPYRKVSVAAQGSVALTLTPSISFKVQVDINGLLQTDTHITAAFPNRMVIGVGTSSTCPNGLLYRMDYQQQFNLITNRTSLGWDMPTKKIYEATKQLIPPQCYSFTADNVTPGNLLEARVTGNATDISGLHSIQPRADGGGQGPAVNPLFPDPRGSCLVCPRDTFFASGVCSDFYDQDGNPINAECRTVDDDLASKKRSRDTDTKSLRPEYEGILRWFQQRGSIVKRGKDSFSICGKLGPLINFASLDFPPSSSLINGYRGITYKTYSPDDIDDVHNYGFGEQMTPALANSNSYGSEHILLKQFFTLLEVYKQNELGKGKSQIYPNAASGQFAASRPLKKDNWLRSPTWTFCEHLKFWLDSIPITATWYDQQVYQSGSLSQTMIQALPNNKFYYDELVLLDSRTNTIKQAAWNKGVFDVRQIDNCLRVNNYQGAMCLMRQLMFAIRYHQLTTATLQTQALRVANFLESMENNAAVITDPNYVTQPYQRLGLASCFKRFMFDKTALAGQKMGMQLIEGLHAVNEKLGQATSETAGGGTTTGAQQLNPDIMKQYDELQEALAGLGFWSWHPDSGDPNANNPFQPWSTEAKCYLGVLELDKE
ncbi:glycoside hydrolase family 18 protein [Trichoderma pleuroticola]